MGNNLPVTGSPRARCLEPERPSLCAPRPASWGSLGWRSVTGTHHSSLLSSGGTSSALDTPREGEGQLSSRAETLGPTPVAAGVEEGQKVRKETQCPVLIAPGPGDRLQNSSSEVPSAGYQVQDQALDPCGKEAHSPDSLSGVCCPQGTPSHRPTV